MGSWNLNTVIFFIFFVCFLRTKIEMFYISAWNSFVRLIMYTMINCYPLYISKISKIGKSYFDFKYFKIRKDQKLNKIIRNYYVKFFFFFIDFFPFNIYNWTIAVKITTRFTFRAVFFRQQWFIFAVIIRLNN